MGVAEERDGKAGAPEGAPTLVVMRDISKAFGEAQILREVGFDLRAGEVHALLGENGAGKSTLMKILMGVHRPDEGRVLLDGADITDQSVHDKRGRGIAMIFQELSLLPNLTVGENILLGREPRKPGWRIDFAGLRREAQRLLDTYDFPIRAGDRVETLGFAQRQMVEIVKALASGARVLIMDEPTSSLTVREEDKLFAIIRALKAKDIGIIYISHRMAEIFKISDRISVIKDGRMLPTEDIGATSTRRIAELMSRGAPPVTAAGAQPTSDRDGHRRSAFAASARRGSSATASTSPSRGARSSALRASSAAAARPSPRRSSASCPMPPAPSRSAGVAVRPASPRRAIAAGFGFVPEDRRGEGLVVDHGLAANMGLPSLRRLRLGGGRFPVILPGAADGLFATMQRQLRIMSRSPRQAARELSGGNQQKVVVAKWLATGPKLLILDEPTSGVDVNAKEEMRLIVRDAASKGMGVLLIASEMEELSRVADRIVTIVDGVLGQTLPGGASEADLRAALQEDLEALRGKAHR
jgi:ABC-type sugar transport system ATPase subunit